MRKRWEGLLLWLTVLMIVPLPAFAGAPLETMQTQVNNVLGVLGDPALKGESAKAVKEKKVWSVADSIFDYTELSKRTLAQQWQAFTPEQQKEFTSLFGKLLGNLYLGKMMSYTNEKVVFKKETRTSEDTAEVQSEIVTQTKTIPIHYRMILKQDEWKVYDVVIEGISLVMNYRSQFREILANKSPEDLLKMLREKVRG